MDVAATTNLTRLDVALPFIIAVVLVLAGAIVSALALRRVSDVLSKWAQDQGVIDTLPESFRPESIAQMSQWTIDTAQVLTGLLAPLVGLVLLRKHGASDGLALAYLVAVVAALGIFTRFLLADPSKYGASSPPLLTPVVAMTLLLNVAGAVVAYVLGP